MKCKILMLFALSVGLISTVSAGADPTYTGKCSVCHATGVAGAPKLGDKEAWSSRISQGVDALLATAIAGKGAMPPKGACVDCSDIDLKSAIEYMLNAVK